MALAAPKSESTSFQSFISLSREIVSLLNISFSSKNPKLFSGRQINLVCASPIPGKGRYSSKNEVVCAQVITTRPLESNRAEKCEKLKTRVYLSYHYDTSPP